MNTNVNKLLSPCLGLFLGTSCVCVCVYAYMYVYMHLFIFWSTVNATVFLVSVPDTSLLLYTNAANL